ncbi:MAG: hypothetical protein EZS28_003162 [Streblomastix strix]|uniref:Uncharacterized protein n=1 Tax=Streblomastix strix TaxID=222440 RepID=A0A5J4X221_9EUKA|nr:MAG: hypothetical protein EZS28_003162 [Streblomastix strix]
MSIVDIEKASRIRGDCLLSLQWLQFFGDLEQNQYLILKTEYISALIDSFSVSGLEEDSRVIKISQSNYRYILFMLREGSPQYPPQTFLYCHACEIVEEEGGAEEYQAHQFRSNEMGYDEQEIRKDLIQSENQLFQAKQTS